MKFASLILLSIVLAACNGAVSNNDTVVNAAVVSPTPTAVTEAATKGSTVSIDSPDGLKLIGSWYESAKPNSPALILLHQWQSDRHSYDVFAKRMQAKGFAVLSIDGRGFGESVKASDGKTVKPERTDVAVKLMLGDVDAAFEFLAKQKNVDATKIGIVGASYGSSLALIFAADHPKVAAVALLSPGLNYFGNMPTEPAIKKYGDRPLYLLAALDDSESATAVNTLNPMVDSKAKYSQTIHPAGGHGTALLKVGAMEEMDDFFSTNLRNK